MGRLAAVVCCVPAVPGARAGEAARASGRMVKRAGGGPAGPHQDSISLPQVGRVGRGKESLGIGIQILGGGDRG